MNDFVIISAIKHFVDAHSLNLQLTILLPIACIWQICQNNFKLAIFRFIKSFFYNGNSIKSGCSNMENTVRYLFDGDNIHTLWVNVHSREWYQNGHSLCKRQLTTAYTSGAPEFTPGS